MTLGSKSHSGSVAQLADLALNSNGLSRCVLPEWQPCWDAVHTTVSVVPSAHRVDAVSLQCSKLARLGWSAEGLRRLTPAGRLSLQS